MKCICSECWDELDHDSEGLCDWCAMTPKQRIRRLVLNYVLLAVYVSAFAGALIVLDWV